VICHTGPTISGVMTSMRKLIIAVAAAGALAPRVAGACGVVNFGEVFADIAKSLVSTEERVSTPDVIVGLDSGGTVGGSVGWAWGERAHGGLFPGSSVERVLVDLHADHSYALTYGWYDNTLLGLGFDFGAETNHDGVGPTARLTLGLPAVALRFTGTMALYGGPNPKFDDRAEIVFDMTEVVGKL
jgi:hypothetical protein